MKRLIKASVYLLTPVICILFVMAVIVDHFTPSQLTMASPATDVINGSFPLSLRYDDSNAVLASLDQSHRQNSLKAKLMIFGFFPVKEVNVEIAERKNVIVGGQPFGIRIYTEGLVVSAVSDIVTKNGRVCPAKKAGIEKGDILLSANGTALRTNEQLQYITGSSEGMIMLDVKREGRVFRTGIEPVFDADEGVLRLGLHIRDSIAGLGTMTYIDPEDGSFFGLGHGICDTESGCLMPMLEGDAVRAEITSVSKSICGTPGSLIGHFCGSEALGTLSANTAHGVYGKLAHIPEGCTAVPVAFRHEIVRGPAVILTTTEGAEPQEYEAEIEEISYNDSSKSRNIIIHITDERLLKKTGGIVQGMSGSPVLQNGRLIAAITHVFINDPTRGYCTCA